MRIRVSFLVGALLFGAPSPGTSQTAHGPDPDLRLQEGPASLLTSPRGEWAGHESRAEPDGVVDPARSTAPEVQGTLTGRVTDAESGAPLGGVQVYIDALDRGTLTEATGRYLLQNVPDGTHTLTAERIGYATTNVEVTIQPGATVIQDFALSQAVLAMDEIVVTGQPGGTRRRAIGNKVSEVNASDIVDAVPVGDMQEVLDGSATSVNMMGSGVVGAAPRMRVRGSSTFSLTNNPLVYIDGVRINNDETTGFMFGNNAGVRSALTALDPQQIEKMEVLKGPAAATLYGTEASRGVINIITKRGRAGPARVNVMVRQGVNFVQNPEGRIGFQNFWTDPDNGDVISVNMIDRLKGQGRMPFSYGSVQTYNANVTGGSEDTQYFFSGTWSDETGVYEWNWMEKLNLRGNIDSQLHEDLGVSVNLGYTNSEDRLPTDGFASIQEGIQFGSARNFPEQRCERNPGFGCDLFNGFNTFDVPVRDRSLVNKQFLDRFTGGVTFTFEPLDWLTTRLTTGIDQTSEKNVAFREFQTNDTAVASLGANGRKGFRNESRWSRFQTTTDLSATAELDLTSSLTGSTSVGFQYYTKNFNFLQADGQQFAGPGLRTVTSTAIISTPQNNDVQNNTLGFYGQETFGWKDRLFLTGAVRVDNNSAFGSDIDLITYPKASLSWVLSESDWFDDISPSWLDGLRLRVAWGQSGEQPPAFSALRTWTPVTGPENSTGVTPNTVGNPDLDAEVGEEIEIGFDSEFLDSRLALDFTYYDKTTKDAILERDLPPSNGFTSIDARIVNGRRFNWNLGFNFSWNEGEIKRLSGQPGDTTIVFNSWSSMEHRVGHAPNSWFGVKVVDAEVDAQGNVLSAQCSDGRGGSTACFDANGSTIAPRVELGRAIAPVEMSLTTDATFFEDFHLHARFTSEQGHKRFDNTQRQRCRLYRVCRANSFPAEWDAEMRATVISSDQIIDAWVNDVSFIRLKEISVSWDVPARYLQGFGLSRASLQVAGRNLLTFTDWTGTDPETMFSSGGRAFMAQNNLPLPQSIITTLRVTF